jgi:hypothetical protein
MVGKLLPSTTTRHTPSLPTLSLLITHTSDNLHHALNSLGSGIVVLFALASLSGIHAMWRREDPARGVIPLTVVIYFLTLSMATGLIERYISVLFPLLATQILTEGYLRTKSIFQSPSSLAPLATALLTLTILALTPQLFTKSRSTPRFGEKHTPITHCKFLIEPESPIFSLNTMEPYLLGGSYRTLPNDNLHKIADYAQLTGVRWLFLRQSALDAQESEIYSNSPWLHATESPAALSPRYELRCESLHGDAQLYAIIPEQ